MKLKTLITLYYDQVQLFPSVFCGVFCEAGDHLTAQKIGQLFTINFSEQEEKLKRETPVVTFWRHFLLECEGEMLILFFIIINKKYCIRMDKSGSGSFSNSLFYVLIRFPKVSHRNDDDNIYVLKCLYSLSVFPQLEGAPSPFRTSFALPQEVPSNKLSVPSLLPPSPSSILSHPPH